MRTRSPLDRVTFKHVYFERVDKSHKVSDFELYAYKRLLPDAVSISNTLLAWLVLHRRLQLDGPVVVLGSFPVPEKDMARCLSTLGVTDGPASPDSQYLIVGWKEWKYVDLRRLLEMRIGSTLRVYSQEMFLAYAISGIDPLDEPKVVKDLAGPHPALHFLQNVFAFDWPSTYISPDDTKKWLNVDVFLNLQEGYLKYEGYTVGKSGHSRLERRKTLDHCYLDGVVPSVFPDEYVSEWGTPATSTRLNKIASCIATFCSNAKKKRVPPLEAIGDWEEDLQYLKSTYYEGQYLFEWPSTSVW